VIPNLFSSPCRDEWALAAVKAPVLWAFGLGSAWADVGYTCVPRRGESARAGTRASAAG